MTVSVPPTLSKDVYDGHLDTDLYKDVIGSIPTTAIFRRQCIDGLIYTRFINNKFIEFQTFGFTTPHPMLFAATLRFEIPEDSILNPKHMLELLQPFLPSSGSTIASLIFSYSGFDQIAYRALLTEMRHYLQPEPTHPGVLLYRIADRIKDQNIRNFIGLIPAEYKCTIHDEKEKCQISERILFKKSQEISDVPAPIEDPPLLIL